LTELERAFTGAVLSAVRREGIPGRLGKGDGTLYYTDGAGTRHADRCWCRIGDSESPSEVVVRCVTVPQTYNLPVIVAEREGTLTVIDIDAYRAYEWSNGQYVNVPGHWWTHGRYGSDPLYVTGLSFLPLAAHPSNPPDLTVTVEGCSYRYSSTWKQFPTTTSGSLSAYRPAATNVTHYVILALDRSDNSLDIIDGDDVIGGNRVLPDAATVLATAGMAAAHWPLAAIRLYNGQTRIMPRDIFMDLRLWAGEGGGSGGASDFTDLDDTPASYTDQAGQILQVNVTEDALEFADRIGTVTKRIPLPMFDGGIGQGYIDPYLGSQSLAFFSDGDESFTSIPVPSDWDQASDMALAALVCSESNEAAGADFLWRTQIASYIEGDTVADAGQTPTVNKVFTAPDAIAADEVYLVEGTIDYNHGTYPIQAGGCISIQIAIDMTGEDGISNGPAHIISWWLEYQADRLGE